jgi:hypothetical protein
MPILPARCSAYAASQASATWPSGNLSRKRGGSSATAAAACARDDIRRSSCNQSRSSRPKSPMESERSATAFKLVGRGLMVAAEPQKGSGRCSLLRRWSRCAAGRVAKQTTRFASVLAGHVDYRIRMAFLRQ